MVLGFSAYLGFLYSVSNRPELKSYAGPVSTTKALLAIAVAIVLVTPAVAFTLFIKVDNLLLTMLLGKFLLFGWALFAVFGLAENLSINFGVYGVKNRKHRSDIESLAISPELTLVFLNI